MRRREFISLIGIGSVAAMWPLAARAQQVGKMPLVGVLVTLSAPHPFAEALRSGMRDGGTHATTRFHHASRWSCGRMAARGVRAAGR
ncbi:MAG: hypothetical protein WA322_16830 [Pseudolabrys sp.]